MTPTTYISTLPFTKSSVTIDGLRLESEIPGFRVISATGRDSMQQNIEEIESKIVDGAFYRSKKLPVREINVEFVLIRENVEDLHIAYDKLKGILYSHENAEFVFNDEPNLYYIGTVSSLTSEQIVWNNDSQGTFTIHCSTPFKYGKDLIEIDTDSADHTQFTIQYDGTYKSYPILETSFSNDCGYVGFTDGHGALQFGNPDEANEGYVQTDQTVNILQYSKGTSLDATTFTNNSSFAKNSAVVIPLGVVQNGSLNTASITKNNVTTYDSKGNKAYTKNYSESVVKLNNLGHGTSSAIWCGSGFKKNFNTVGGTNTAADFFVVFQIAMDALKAGVNQTTSTETDPRQVGMMQFVVSDSGGRPLLGMVFLKNNQSTSCEVRLYAGDKELLTDRVDGEKNKNLNVYANSKQNKYLFWDHGEFSMSRIGDKVDFYVEHKHHTFSIKSTPALRQAFNTQDPDPANHRVAMSINGFIGRLDTTGVSGNTYGASYNPLREMYFRGFAALKYNATEWKDIANVFMNHDVLEVNTNDGTIKLNGIIRDDLGAIGNEWDEFCLRPGPNIIKIAKSGWATLPNCVLKYRKVFV